MNIVDDALTFDVSDQGADDLVLLWTLHPGTPGAYFSRLVLHHGGIKYEFYVELWTIEVPEPTVEINCSTRSGDGEWGHSYPSEEMARLFEDLEFFTRHLAGVREIVAGPESNKDIMETPDRIWSHEYCIKLMMESMGMWSADLFMADCIGRALGAFMAFRLRGMSYTLKSSVF